MNRNFEDSRYYLKRARETAAAGISEEIGAVEARVRALVGREAEPETESRVDDIRAELSRLAARAEGEARVALEDARERLDAYRAEQAPEP
jgi:hypothetical protein